MVRSPKRTFLALQVEDHLAVGLAGHRALEPLHVGQVGGSREGLPALARGSTPEARADHAVGIEFYNTLIPKP
jgi:hypothetical protein